MSAPFAGALPFDNPAGLQVLQGGQGAPQEGPQQPQQPQGQPPGHEHPPIDLEGELAEAMETGCRMCSAAADVSSEDFKNFAAGVSSLADAMQKLQPQQQEGPDQTLATAQLDAQTRLTIADRQAAGELDKANIGADTEIQKANIAADVQRETAKIAADAKPKEPPKRSVSVSHDRHGRATKYESS